MQLVLYVVMHFYLLKYIFFFQKACNWDDSNDASVKRMFYRVAGKRYGDWLCKMRIEGKKEEHIPEDVWESWQQHWNTPEYKKKREQAAKNRRTEKGGPGTGLSTHTGGSRSTIQHCIALVRILRIFF